MMQKTRTTPIIRTRADLQIDLELDIERPDEELGDAVLR